MAKLGTTDTDPSPHSISVDVGFTSPPVIYTNMGLADWEQHFQTMMEKDSSPAEKHSYRVCYHTFRWARFCSAERFSMTLQKAENAYNLKIRFSFSVREHMGLFFNRLDEIIKTFV